MLAFTDDIWKVLAALVIFVITAIAQGMQKARQSRREAGEDSGPSRGPTPTFDPEEPWATAEPPPLERTRRTEPRPVEDDWEAELRRLLGGEPAAPPPPPPPPVVVQMPSPAPPPPLRPSPKPVAVPRVSAADAALTRLVGHGHKPAAFQHRSAQRPAPVAVAASRTARRLAEHWRDPRNAREAVIASLILGPPRALEERPNNGLAVL